jgi:hypothetical protein
VYKLYKFRHFKAFPMLDLSHLLHKSGFLNDSLSVALGCLTYDPEHSLLHYFIGNIYAVGKLLLISFDRDLIVCFILILKDFR